MTIALLNPAFDVLARYETTDDVDRGFARGDMDVETAAHALRLLERGYGPGTIGLMNVRDVHILAERMRAENEEQGRTESLNDVEGYECREMLKSWLRGSLDCEDARDFVLSMQEEARAWGLDSEDEEAA